MPRGSMQAPTKDELRKTIEALTTAIEALEKRLEEAENKIIGMEAKQSILSRLSDLFKQRDNVEEQLREAS
jgi:chaperonin cofactor prefoldin